MPPVSSSVKLSAIPNTILMKTMPSILFSTKAPNILFGKIRITVPYKLESPVVGENESTSPSYPERLKTQPNIRARLTAIPVVIRYRPMVFVAIEPSFTILLNEDIPETKEKKTNGTTTSISKFLNI